MLNATLSSILLKNFFDVTFKASQMGHFVMVCIWRASYSQKYPFFFKWTPFWNLIFKKENNYIFRRKLSKLHKKTHNFACDNYIFPKTRSKKNKQGPIWVPLHKLVCYHSWDITWCVLPYDVQGSVRSRWVRYGQTSLPIFFYQN